MTRVPLHPTALLVAGIVLLVAPALLPVQPVLYHDTGPGTFANESVLVAEGYEIVAYEDLSPRAKELYVRALRNGGEHTVALDEGAEEFRYPTRAELGATADYRARTALQTIVIERPVDGSLPPPDEPLAAAEHVLEERRERAEREASTPGGDREGSDSAVDPGSSTQTAAEPSLEAVRRQIGRYDQMTTRTDLPPAFAPPSLLRLLSLVAGSLAVAVGGYLSSLP